MSKGLLLKSGSSSVNISGTCGSGPADDSDVELLSKMEHWWMMSPLGVGFLSVVVWATSVR